jgi:hypothetical protein
VPWQECTKMDERLKFLARLLDGVNQASLSAKQDRRLYAQRPSGGTGTRDHGRNSDETECHEVEPTLLRLEPFHD